MLEGNLILYLPLVITLLTVGYWAFSEIKYRIDRVFPRVKMESRVDGGGVNQVAPSGFIVCGQRLIELQIGNCQFQAEKKGGNIEFKTGDLIIYGNNVLNVVVGDSKIEINATESEIYVKCALFKNAVSVLSIE